MVAVESNESIEFEERKLENQAINDEPEPKSPVKGKNSEPDLKQAQHN